MTDFNIHREDWGEALDEGLEEEYIDGLAAAFYPSPEGSPWQERGFWARSSIEYGLRYLGCTPPELSVPALEELLFDILPRKISADEDSCEYGLAEIRALWTYLKRAYQLDNADDILAAMEGRDREFFDAMMDPSRWGMAKGFVMGAKGAGVDTSSEAEMNQWMALQSLQAMGGLPGAPVASTESQLERDQQRRQQKMRQKKKQKRKMTKAARPKKKKKKKK